MNDVFLLKTLNWEELKKLISEEIKNNLNMKPKKFLKSSEVCELLGGICAAKLQSLRVGGHLPAINADGLWLYDYDEIMSFLNRNKINSERSDD